jgi:hypothetical protein
MKYKKIVLISIISLGLSFGFSVLAVARLSVPKNSPLQPIPQGTAPNVSNNINTPNSDINKNLQSQIPPATNTEQTNPTQNTDQSGNLNQPAPIVGNVPTTSSTLYWILLFIGLAGLMCIGLWAYMRFLRKQ